MNAEFRALA